MALPNPIIERERKKHTREGFSQYLLPSLILGEGPKKWNTPYRMWPYGLKVVADLCTKAFDGAAGPGDGRFYWEFRLEAPASPAGRWPDLATQTEDRLILFELKTEAGSIREGQVDEYLELARAQFPDLHVDTLYLTRDPVADAPVLPDRARYGNLTWAEVAAILEARSSDLDGVLSVASLWNISSRCSSQQSSHTRDSRTWKNRRSSIWRPGTWTTDISSRYSTQWNERVRSRSCRSWWPPRMKDTDPAMKSEG
jgi:hypothetical protein